MVITLDEKCTSFGCVSDTHGAYRPEIAACFEGVDAIFHAGDIGKPVVLRELNAIAPVVAVRGNVDIPSWFPELQKEVIVEVGTRRIALIHNLYELDSDPGAAGIDIVVYGHTHKAAARRRKGVWYINPGSAGPHRFLSKAQVAVMELGEKVSVRHFSLR